MASVRCLCPGSSLACSLDTMKRPGAAERLRLVVLLEAALMREDRLWKVPVFKNGCIQVSPPQVGVPALVRCRSDRRSSPSQGTNISSAQHREMILWLGEMSRLFQFCPDTSALGVCILNRLLSTVKVEGRRFWRILNSATTS